jgi:hypothetical protein
MSWNATRRRLLATVDTRELNEVRWGPLRDMFPTFVEEMELDHYLRQLLAGIGCHPVEIVPREESTHIFDVFVREPTE